MRKKILIIAPHLSHPFHNGADISIINLIYTLSEKNFTIDIAHSTGIINYTRTYSLRELEFPKTNKISKILISLKALLKLDSYSTQKFFTNKLKNHLLNSNTKYHSTIYSYLGIYYKSYKYVNSDNHYIWTHNNDLKWYDYRKLKPGLRKISFFVSHNATIKYLMSVEKNSAKLITVSHEDEIAYSKYSSNIISVSIGVDQVIVKRSYTKETKTDLPALGFVGSLGNDMNLEALKYFQEQYWPKLKSLVHDFRVIGSNPSSEVIRIVRENNWRSYYNLEQSSFDKEVAKLDFLVMPFKVNNGFKLKTLLSFKFGIPILSSSAISLDKCYIGVSSNNAHDWISFIKKNLKHKRKNEQHLHLQLKNFSWEKSLRNLINELYK